MGKEEAIHQITELVEKYRKLEEEGKLNKINEETTKKDFILPLFEALGWNTTNKTNRNDSVTAEENIGGKRVDYGFKINGIPKFFLEAKSFREGTTDIDYIKQAVNYAYHRSCTWAVLTDFKEIRVLNAEIKSTNPLDIQLFQLDCANYIENIDQLYLLSKESFENELIDKQAEKWGKKQKRTPINKQLLDDFTRFREILSKNVLKLNSSRNLTEEDLDESVQRILDRLIFIRNCEDQHLEPTVLQPNLRMWESKGRGQLIKSLRDVFRDYDKNYDSKLFTEHLCDSLDIDNEALSEIISGLYNNKDMVFRYNFAYIEADVLGNIYEQYLGHILRKTEKRAKLKEDRAHRKEQGIYYTPTYIVDYIVKNTLGEMLKDLKINQDKIRILDPACGSGSFLIKTFDTLYQHHQKKADNYTETNKSDIVKNHIFGVDLDKQAVEIAQLNLLLKIAEKGHKLPLLQNNIKNGNSLIDDPSVAGDKAFNWKEQFKDIMGAGGFDIIIGNPPYGADLKENELEYLEKKLKTTNIRNYDTYVFFIENVLPLIKEGGLFGFIVPDTFLRKSDMLPLREVILDNFKVRIIAEVGAVFGEAKVTENVIFVLEKCSSESERKNNILIHQTLNKNRPMQERLQAISKHEWDSIGKVAQKSWMESPEKRLGKFNSLELIKLINKIEKGTAIENISDIEISRGSEGGKNQIVGMPKDESFKSIVIPDDIDKYQFRFSSRFFPIRDSNQSKYSKEKIVVIRIRNTSLPDRIIAAYDNSGTYCLKTLQILNVKDGSKLDIKYLLGLMNSKIMNFYCHHFLSDDINKRYLQGLKIISNPEETDKKKLVEFVDNMLSLNKGLVELGDKKTDERSEIEEEIKKTDEEIDSLVYKIYGLTEDEIRVVEDSLK